MRSVAFSEYLIFSLLLILELPSASQNAPTTSSSPPVIPTTAPPQPTTVSDVTEAPTEPSVPHTGTSSRTTRHTGSTTPSDNTTGATTAWTEPTTTSEYVTHDGRIGQAILVLLSCLGITLGAVNMIFAWLMVWEFRLKIVFQKSHSVGHAQYSTLIKMSSDSEASSMGRLLWDMIKGNYDGLVQTSSPPLTLKSVSASGFALMQCIMALEEIGGQKVQKEIIKEKNRLLNTAADWGDLLRAVGNEMGPKRNMVKLFYKHEHVLQATPEKNNDIARAVGVNSFEPTLQPLNFVSDPTGRYLKYFIDKEYQVKARIPEVVPINTRIRSTARLLVTNGLAVELDWDCPLVPGEGKFSIKPMANEQDTVRVPTLELAKDCVDFQVNPDVSAIYFNGKNVNVEAVVIYVSGDKEHALHMLDYETIEMAMEMGRQGQKARMTLVLPQPKSVEPISLRLVNAKTKLTGEGRLKRVAMNLKSLFRRGRKVRFGRCFSPNKADFCPFETKMNFGMENAFPLYDFFMYTQCHPHLVQEIDRSIKIKFPKIEREEKKVEAKTTQNIRGEAFSGHVFFSGDGKFVIAAEKKAGSDEAVDFNNGLRSMLKNNPSEETSQTVKKMKKPQKVGEMGSNRMATAGDAASPAPVASAVPVANRKVISSTYIMYIVYQSPEGPIILELSLNSLL